MTPKLFAEIQKLWRNLNIGDIAKVEILEKLPFQRLSTLLHKGIKLYLSRPQKRMFQYLRRKVKIWTRISIVSIIGYIDNTILDKKLTSA